MSIPAPGARDKWLGGPPLRQFNDLVEEHGVDAIEAARQLLEPGVSSPMRNVERLAGLVLLTDEERAPAAPATTEAPPNLYELAEQRRQEALADAPPVSPDEAKAELERVRAAWRSRWQDEPAGEGEAIAR